MNTETTPQWLKDGAFSQFRKKTSYEGKFMLVIMIIMMITLILSFKMLGKKYNLADNSLPSIAAFMALIIVITGSTIAIHYAFLAWKKKQVGNMKKWQTLYLQSKIDEFVTYEKDVAWYIAAAKERAEQEIKLIKDNYKEMKEKAEQAKELLALS